MAAGAVSAFGGSVRRFRSGWFATACGAASTIGASALAADFSVANDAQLRSAITTAGNGDTITFTGNITLAADLPAVQRNVTISVDGSKIAKIGPDPVDATYRLDGLTVLPGFIDTHAHIAWHFGPDGKYQPRSATECVENVASRSPSVSTSGGRGTSHRRGRK